MKPFHALLVQVVERMSRGRAVRGAPPGAELSDVEDAVEARPRAGAAGGVGCRSGGSRGSAWAEWWIKDIGGRLLRIDMEFHAWWPNP